MRPTATEEQLDDDDHPGDEQQEQEESPQQTEVQQQEEAERSECLPQQSAQQPGHVDSAGHDANPAGNIGGGHHVSSIGNDRHAGSIGSGHHIGSIGSGRHVGHHAGSIGNGLPDLAESAERVCANSHTSDGRHGTHITEHDTAAHATISGARAAQAAATKRAREALDEAEAAYSRTQRIFVAERAGLDLLKNIQRGAVARRESAK